MNTTIEVDDAAVRLAFNRMLAAGQNPRAYLGAIGDALKNSTKLRFVAGKAPDGTRWAPLSAVTIARRRKGKGGGSAQPLRDTGRLMNSITFYQRDRDSVIVGTDVIYAAMQHFGAKQGSFGRTKRNGPIPWGDVPARPFFGLSSDDREEIVNILRERIVGTRVSD